MISSQWFGKTDYTHSLKIMDSKAQAAKQSGFGYVLGFEYDTTITMGMRAHKELSGIPQQIDSIPVVPVSRGGLVTLHNPGQAVIYPVVPIKKWNIFAKQWVEVLTDVTEKSLSKCNIIVSDKNAGVFSKIGKVASIGIDLKGGVSTHGIAVNIGNDLSEFSKITPCGISHAVFDRVGDHCDITTEEFFALWAQEFASAVEPFLSQSLTKSLSAP